MLNRNEYGALLITSAQLQNEELLETQLWNMGQLLISQAARAKKLPARYNNITTEWKRSKPIYSGSAIQYELYDISAKHEIALVCVRKSEGSKYGINTTSKTYYFVKKYGRGVQVTEVNKALPAKAAKSNPGELGYVIQVLRGVKSLKLKQSQTRIGYKIVRRDEEGLLVSVFDGSEWRLGKCRKERATDDLTGGFYYYKSKDLAIAAAKRDAIFPTREDLPGLVLLEVEVSGKEYAYGNGKFCVTSLKPLRILEEFAEEQHKLEEKNNDNMGVNK